MKLTNKVVLISGAGKGIGRACALAFAEQGAKVALFARDEKTLQQVKKAIQKYNVPYVIQSVDINQSIAVEHFVKTVVKELGKIDILINNAGLGLVKKFETTSEEEYETVMSTNFKGSFFLTQRCMRYFQKNANIIFVSSIHSEHPSLDPIYDASKAAINNLVLNLALSFAPKNIRVNAVVPGHIDVQTILKPRSQKDVPLGKKAGLPNDVANACLFLADNEKARYITGVLLPITGGLHIPIAKDINF